MQTYGRTTLQFAKDYKKLPAAQRVSALSSYEDFLTEEHSHNRLSSPDYKKTINGLNALNKIITDPDINLDLC